MPVAYMAQSVVFQMPKTNIEKKCVFKYVDISCFRDACVINPSPPGQKRAVVLQTTFSYAFLRMNIIPQGLIDNNPAMA